MNKEDIRQRIELVLKETIGDYVGDLIRKEIHLQASIYHHFRNLLAEDFTPYLNPIMITLGDTFNKRGKLKNKWAYLKGKIVL